MGKMFTEKEVAEILKEYAWDECLSYYCKNVCPYRNDEVMCENACSENGVCKYGDEDAHIWLALYLAGKG